MNGIPYGAGYGAPKTPEELERQRRTEKAIADMMASPVTGARALVEGADADALERRMVETPGFGGHPGEPAIPEWAFTEPVAGPGAEAPVALPEARSPGLPTAAPSYAPAFSEIESAAMEAAGVGASEAPPQPQPGPAPAAPPAPPQAPVGPRLSGHPMGMALGLPASVTGAQGGGWPGVPFPAPGGPQPEPAPPPKSTDIEDIKKRLGFSWGKDVDLDPRTGRPTTSTMVQSPVGTAGPGMASAPIQAREAEGGGGFVFPEEPAYLPESMIDEAAKRAQLARSQAEAEDPWGVTPIIEEAEAMARANAEKARIMGEYGLAEAVESQQGKWKIYEGMVRSQLQSELDALRDQYNKLENPDQKGLAMAEQELMDAARQKLQGGWMAWQARQPQPFALPGLSEGMEPRQAG